MSLPEERGWEHLALCAGLDLDFFDLDPRSTHDNLRTLVEVCRCCPVQLDCLLTAIMMGSASGPGVWGGLTPAQRRKVASLTPDELSELLKIHRTTEPQNRRVRKPAKKGGL